MCKHCGRLHTYLITAQTVCSYAVTPGIFTCCSLPMRYAPGCVLLWLFSCDVIKWKHSPRHWPLCGEFTGHGRIPLTKASDAELWWFLWSAPWINGWVNNREAGDLRRHRTHCDVIVMLLNSHFDVLTGFTWSIKYILHGKIMNVLNTYTEGELLFWRNFHLRPQVSYHFD